MKELLFRLNWNPADIDEVIIGNVAQPAECGKFPRVIALKAGIPKQCLRIRCIEIVPLVWNL